jgi:hypothetical protein
MLAETFAEVLDAHSAGSPTDERVRWTDLKPMHLATELVARGVALSRITAAKLLDQAGFRRRAPLMTPATVVLHAAASAIRG